SEIGFQSVALTVDHLVLSPDSPNRERDLQQMKDALRDHQMGCVIETGARFLLNARHKHEPTLVTANLAERKKRIDFYFYCIDLAAELKADCVSIWSGILHQPTDDETALARLAEGLQVILKRAAEQNVVIGFEPEPGMYVESMNHFDRMLQWIQHPNLGLTLDIGHLYCLGEVPLADYIERWGEMLVNVHLQDMKAGIHEHLMFGEGEMDFAPVIDAISKTGYRGGVHVELSRHSHAAVVSAHKAFNFLKPLWPS
ncbi:MAG: sugar phosphate isomerase/epimerase family protein, partial [Planctomycetota bacterium]|nr:sugar phosphate isomerase/epimerase family protein [Planctomycetota bacterium]